MRLKPLFPFFFLACLAQQPACAQSQFMLSGGLNFSTFSLDYPSGVTPPDQSNRVGIGVLIGGQNQTSDNFAFALGIGYETRGAVWTGQDDLGNDVDVNINFNYIQIPLVFKFLGGSSGSVQPYFAPSLALGILTKSEATSGSEQTDIHDVNSIDLDLGGTVGLQIPLSGKNRFFLEAGYAYGLLDTDTGDQSSANNSNIKIRLGFLLGS